MCLSSIEDLLEFLVELNKVAIDASEGLELIHAVKLLINLGPFDIIKPVSWIWLRLDSSTCTSKEESPLLKVNFISTKEDLSAKHERE